MFLDMDLAGVTEPKPVPNGRYPLTITEVKYVPDKSYVQVSLAIGGHNDAPNLRHFLSLPKPDDEPQKAHFKRLMTKRFLRQFEITYDEGRGFSTEDLLGATADGQLTLTEPNEEGVVYNQLTVDKLPNE